ncbi:hypothetical protein MNBD_BACTEROID01-456 [hydrothermal vent metagenome]|uniref:NodB homology domain-containing protein n=1 Tax=hydrothermal vent metagenome TaxID=652676 RepID=A0A3B0UK68_9ZZZZ
MKRYTFILPFVSLLLTFCSSPKKETTQAKQDKTYMVICFDVEDYTSPESVGMDDIPKWEAEIMSEEGVTGTFFVIGEKARSLEKRGRTDVIRAMAKHDIGSHTNYGSMHPTVTEILEKASWDDGEAKMLENETAGFNDLERIFGQRPANLARHGGSYGPQLVAALSEMDAGYVYSPIGLPGHNVVWFCNTLNFHGEGNFGSFDDAYYRDSLFNPMLNSLDTLIPQAIANADMVAFFANHPSKVRSIQFWDFNYYKGANPGPADWKTPELRPAESMGTAQKNFRRLVKYLDGRDDIELTTFREMKKLFGNQENEIGKKKLGAIAERILKENAVVIDEQYNPAEVFTALAEALTTYNKDGKLPRVLTVKRPFGPLKMPVEQPEIVTAGKNDVFTLSASALEYITETWHLPSSLLLNGHVVGTGSLLALFSKMYLDIHNGTVTGQLDIIPFPAYPSENIQQIIKEVAAVKNWPVHREDLDMSNLIEMTKLQLWTLKPASIIK